MDEHVEFGISKLFGLGGVRDSLGSRCAKMMLRESINIIKKEKNLFMVEFCLVFSYLFSFFLIEDKSPGIKYQQECSLIHKISILKINVINFCFHFITNDFSTFAKKRNIQQKSPFRAASIFSETFPKFGNVSEKYKKEEICKRRV